MSDNNQNNQSLQEEQLQGIKDIKSKLAYLSGFIISMRSGINNNFRELHQENKKHFYILKNKAELYFYITVTLFFISFFQQKLGETSFFISLFSDQNILEFFKLLYKK